MLYPFSAAILFPNAKPDLPVPTELWNRIFWTTLVSGLIGIAASRVFSKVEAPTVNLNPHKDAA